MTTDCCGPEGCESCGCPPAAILRPAERPDVEVLERLLRTNHLPTVGVREALDGFVVGLVGGRVVAAAGVESCGSEAGLLRSVVVDASVRDTGIGHLLVEHAISDAQRRGVASLYLLTTTAEGWFPRFGFAAIDRALVPEGVRATAEFCDACPSSATVMVRRLSS